MKIHIVMCNYNAQLHLDNTIKSLIENINENVTLNIIDNNSQDRSIEIIDKYKDNFYKIIKSPQNIGKAKGLNNLVKLMNECNPLHEDDLILSLDSDISIVTENFFDKSFNIWKKLNNKSCCMVGFQQGNSLMKRKMSFLKSIDNSFEYFADPHGIGSGIAGGSIFIPYKYFKLINGYRENMGPNGNAAIYGGNDGWLMYDLAVKTHLPVVVIKTLQVFHPFEEDQNYQKWKDQLHKEHLMYGHSITQIPYEITDK